jgi:hypothetical protein
MEFLHLVKKTQKDEAASWQREGRALPANMRTKYTPFMKLRIQRARGRHAGTSSHRVFVHGKVPCCFPPVLLVTTREGEASRKRSLQHESSFSDLDGFAKDNYYFSLSTIPCTPFSIDTSQRGNNI